MQAAQSKEPRRLPSIQTQKITKYTNPEDQQFQAADESFTTSDWFWQNRLLLVVLCQPRDLVDHRP
jgi:hypothetical protein